MTEVSTWDPVDDNNSAASPAGWPEGMMPSGVNNSARMMMGAVRREHDRIVGQIGSTAGTITAPVINTTTVNTTTVNATGTANVQNIAFAGEGGHFSFGWDGTNTHVFVDGSDVGTIGDISSVTAGNGLTGGGTTGALSLAMSGSYTGNFSVSGLTNTGSLGVSGNAQVNGTINANGNISGATISGTFLYSSGNVNAAGNISASGTVGATGDIYGSSLHASVNITASNTVQGSYVYSSGNMDCAGNVDTPGTGYFGGVVLPNQASYYARDTGGNAQSLLAMGNNNWCLLSTGAATVTTNAQFAHNNHLYSLSSGGFYCGLSANAWAGVIAFSFPAPSDQRLKTDIEDLPDDCTALVSAISPRRYRWRDGVNALDPSRTHWGFIAQEIGAAFKTAGLDFGGYQIGDDEDKTETLDVNELVALLFGAVKELTAKVKQLETALVR